MKGEFLLKQKQYIFFKLSSEAVIKYVFSVTMYAYSVYPNIDHDEGVEIYESMPSINDQTYVIYQLFSVGYLGLCCKLAQ